MTARKARDDAVAHPSTRVPVPGSPPRPERRQVTHAELRRRLGNPQASPLMNVYDLGAPTNRK